MPFVENFRRNISVTESSGEDDDFCDYESSVYLQFTALN